MAAATTLLLRRTYSSSRSTSSSSSSSSLSHIIFKDPDLNTLAETFKKHSQSNNFRQQIAFYERTVQRLSNAKRFDLIEDILEDQKKYKDITREGFAVRIINLYGKSGMFEHAHKMFDEMPQRNCERTVKSFNALLGACVNSKKFDRVHGFFVDFPRKLSIKPDVVSYNTVINAFCQMGSFDLAVSMLDEMQKEGLNPDLVSFNTLFNGLYKSGKFEDGERIWGMMEKFNVVPDIISYNMKLQGLVLGGKIQEALGLVEEMKTKGLKLDVFTFNTLFKGLTECDVAKSLEEVKRWYSEMMKMKCATNPLTFATLLAFACDKGDFLFGARLCRGLFYRQCELKEGTLVQRVVDGLVEKSNRKEAELLVQLGKRSKYPCYNWLKIPKLD